MKRTYVRVIVSMDSAWRIGSWEARSADAVETLIDDLNGGPLVPGSGIAGGLRRAAGDQAAELFGPAAAGGNTLEASPWWILGTMVSDAEPISQRRRVKIDRTRSAAASKGLFAQDEVRKGTVAIYFRAEDVDAVPFLELLSKWRPRIGGSRTTGMGRAHVTSIRYRTFDLDTKKDFLELLQADSPTAPKRIDELLKAGEKYRVSSEETTPLVQAAVRCDYLAQPDEPQSQTYGTAWKGVLRSRVEFIARSLNLPVCGKEDEWTGCGECPVCRAFGSTDQGGVWEFLDSRWDQHTPDSLRRVAIDRFTGGARRGALFTQYFEQDITMTLIIDGEKLEGEDAWVNLALLHALRDLHDGLITVGPEGASGFGMVSLSDITYQGAPLELAAIEPISEGVRA